MKIRSRGVSLWDSSGGSDRNRIRASDIMISSLFPYTIRPPNYMSNAQNGGLHIDRVIKDSTPL